MNERSNTPGPGSYDVHDLRDDATILQVLERDQRWAAYPICDLEPPHRAFARYIGAMRAGNIDGLVLAYAPPEFAALQPCGDPAAIRAVLAEARDLPSTPLLIVRNEDLQAVEQRYHVERSWTMLRLVVTTGALRPAPTTARIARLGSQHLPALHALYAEWSETVFTVPMFQHGIYFGAFVDDVLVAVSGTHAISVRHGMAVIGNVFTQPEHRGQGLASATTGAVTHALREQGIREVALNVREDNQPAIRSYSRLGFALHLSFLEGNARLREGSLA